MALSVATACSSGGPPPSDSRESASAAQRLGPRISAAVDEFMDASYTDAYRDVRAIVVSVGDETVLERYVDSSADEYAPVASVTKSVMSLLVGIAIDQGHITGTEATLAELLPDRTDDMAPGVADVTLAQVLTMTAGLRQDPYAGSAFYDESSNWVRTILAERLEGPPGQAFGYSNGAAHLLSAILVAATGQPVLEYAREHLFDPLGVDTRPAAQPRLVNTADDFVAYREEYERAGFAWPRDRQGHHIGDGFLKLRVHDMARLGRLLLHDGEWEGQQVVPRAWVAESTTTHVQDTTTSRQVVGPGYGYLWWTLTADGHPAFAAAGYGGQLIEVVPDLDLVVAISTDIPDPPLPPTVNTASLTELVDLVIAPAVSK